MKVEYTNTGTRFVAHRALGIGLAAVLTVIWIATLQAQDPRRRRPGERPSEQRSPEERTKRSDSAGKVTAIVGADIYTVTHEVVRQGTVLIEGDKITAVGQGLNVPPNAKIIDARGKWVTPGFIAMSMSGIALSGSSDRNARYADSLDPFDQNIKLALGVGITAGLAQLDARTGFGQRRRSPMDRFLGFEPEIPDDLSLIEEGDDHIHLTDDDHNVCPCCGLPILPTEPIVPPTPSSPTPRRFVVLKMSYGQLDPMLIEKPTFYDPGRGGLSGALNRYNWRQSIERAKKYVADQEVHERAVRAGQTSTPPRKPVADEIIALVKKEIALRVRADSMDEIRDMISLARELDYKLVLDEVTEGWLLADEISKAEVPVVVTPRNRRRARPGFEDASGSSIESTGIYERTGVRFAVTALDDAISLNGLAGRDLTSLPLEAAFAVRGGCRESTALAAITIVPAQLLGLSDRLGSVEKGKDADLLILNGPPLDYRTYVETALVSGRVCYERDKDRVYPVYDR